MLVFAKRLWSKNPCLMATGSASGALTRRVQDDVLRHSRPCQCQSSFPCPARQLVLHHDFAPHNLEWKTWVQSWVQPERRFRAKTGVKLRQINESLNGS